MARTELLLGNGFQAKYWGVTMPPTNDQLDCSAQLERLLGRMKTMFEAKPEATVSASYTDIWATLENGEKQFIELMTGKKPLETDDIEFGPTLYLLWHYLPVIEPKYGQAILDFLHDWLGMPETKITTKQWDDQFWPTIDNGGVASSDGSLVQHSKYAVVDYSWLIAFLEYIFLKHSFLIFKVVPYPFQTSPSVVPINSSDELTIALTGDWGSGHWQDGAFTSPSQQVMEQIELLKPNLTIHLGDVYYAGTETSADGGIMFPGEEVNNFTSLWKQGTLGKSFTLNSNHEMYSGANGYFKDALNADHKSGHSDLFEAQTCTSYFAITFKDWIIFGLDSAYYDQSTLIMHGAISDAKHTQQAKFIHDTLQNNPQCTSVMILTHHTALKTDGSKVNDPLWTQVTQAVSCVTGKNPDVWYFGHVHNGIVYSPSSAGTSTKCRCVGHGALPFGSAYGLDNNTNVTYYANTPLPNGDEQQKNRVLNGFAFLTLGKGTIQETFYDQEGNVAWSGPDGR